MKKTFFMLAAAILAVCIVGQMISAGTVSATAMSDYQDVPLFLGARGIPPLVMLVVGRDHKLYYEAYNDASDLNDDGELDVGYNPEIDYYGYFDSYKVYTYDSVNQRFEPHSVTADKRCTGVSDGWSGDFLNYLTMSRMDALRKVLYGGYRSTDSDATSESSVVLQRVYIPQDAHSWGKEYNGSAAEGYAISDYAPLEEPEEGMRHLFASTTLSDNGTPLLRVLPNNTHRIWEWVAKERPVCDNSLVSAGTRYESCPEDHAEYDELVARFGNASHLQGSDAPANGKIDGSGNPYGADDYYLTIFSGSLVIETGGTYEFSVDGDDAVEVIIDGTVVAGWYGGHGSCGCTDHKGSIYLAAGSHTLEFRHQEKTGGDSYYLRWKGPDSDKEWKKVPDDSFDDLVQSTYDVLMSGSSITDYAVRVVVCDPTMPETNCKEYPSGTLKPTGLLQNYGERGKMYFGLITGSYAKNTSGGVLRKNISPLTGELDPDTGEIDTTHSEINLSTGQFTNENGIIRTLDRLRTVGFSYGDHSYNCNCGWITSRPINEAECRMWGNPIGEMMYEGLRYFAGKEAATSAFTYSGTTDDSTLGLATPEWQNPYSIYEYCAKPIMLVISDINPSFDSDQLPGSEFASFGGDVSGLDVGDLADTIGSEEGETGHRYIGQVGTTYDCACSEKNVTGLGNVRGLCPEEPTKLGSYYSASVAYFGQKTDVNTASGSQKIDTYVVGLASPLPQIKIPVGEHTVTLVPFAKSVGGCYGPYTNFQPTNTIVDFFVESISATEGTFRINYEDVEQGADHDMDAIVEYRYSVNGDSVTITLESKYAAGCIIQHMGYIISGTDGMDGTYLEVRDKDTAEDDDPDYRFDTPDGEGPGGEWDDDVALPLTHTRVFTVGTTSGATLLKNPLWYAAKWGGFRDYNGNNLPDEPIEWDKDSNGIPDTYFYVTNPLYLETQLGRSFAEIVQRVASGSAVSVLATASEGTGTLYQAYFKPTVTEEMREVNWLGFLQGLWVDNKGHLREDTVHDYHLVLSQDKIIEYTFDESANDVRIFKYDDTDGDGEADSDTPSAVEPLESIECIWEAGKLLALRQPNSRTIKTFIDTDNDSVVDESEYIDFTLANSSSLRPYLRAATDEAAGNIIRFIRGEQVAGCRDRQLTVDGQAGRVWKLGDIVSSTPAVVGKPLSNYHIIYGDASYAAYFRQHQNRDVVVYAGGNDGMLHAFWAGRYVEGDNSTTEEKEAGWFSAASGLASNFGDELWAYVPYNLLAHLPWLADPNFPHVYYVDLKPRVAEAQIFAEDDNHPGGWGTVLIVGMRLGGGPIQVNDTFSGGGAEQRTFTSAYAAFDVTVPQSPQLLWEFTDDRLGYTTCYPTDIKVENNWFCIVGSGPNDRIGTSTQAGYIFVLNLRTGAIEKEFATDATAFLANPIAVDLGLNYSNDIIYIGETYQHQVGEEYVTRGKMLRISTRVDGQASADPDDWTMSTVFITDPDQYITAAPAASSDYDGDLFLYFGTGKYLSESDKSDTAGQVFYGIKDPCFRGNCTTTVEKDELFNATSVQVTQEGDVSGAGNDVDDWWSLLNEARGAQGWYLNLYTEESMPSERVVTKPAIVSGLTIFNAFTPNEDICGHGGSSRMYVVNFETGTAHNKDVIGVTSEGVIVRTSAAASGMSSDPTVIPTDNATSSVGSQNSTGVVEIHEDIPVVKSGNVLWKEKR